MENAVAMKHEVKQNIDHEVQKPSITGKLSMFTPREMQLSIAILVVVALIGGVCLQSFSYMLFTKAGLGVGFSSFVLVAGYVLLVSALAVGFSHKVVGPFKRLEYEMKLISDGESGRRLSVRAKDGLAVIGFIKHANRMITVFDERRGELMTISAALSARINALNGELSRRDADPNLAKLEIAALQKQLDDLRKKWN